MPKNWKSSLFISVILLAFTGALHAEVLDEIQTRYSGHRDFVASFSQETFQLLANRTVHFTGKLSVNVASGVRMDVFTPQRQVIILLENTVAIHLPEEGTSTIQEIPKEIATQNILGFFAGLASLEEMYTVSELEDVLLLTPRNGTGSLTIWTTEEHLIHRLLLRDSTGNYSDITLTDYAFDVGLDHDLFDLDFAPEPENRGRAPTD
ncbi:MAG TPA: outer membrane lipoprotein carrier protein LolA [Deltaproteobacteria bacterium]|nr:outer membrane lipoprotein carrier protein LolA [Deltaproteobacteria bacterium]